MTLALPAITAPPARGVSSSTWITLAVTAGMAMVFLADPRVFGDGDIYWHLAAGEWMLSHGRVPDADPFSFTRPGAPWVAHEWLSELLMAAAHRLAGWSGVSVLFAGAAAATAVLLVRRLTASLSGLGLVAAAGFGLGVGAPSLLARPHVLVLPVLMLWTVELLRARDEDRAPRLVIAGLMAVWANLHGSYVFGFLLAGFLGLEALISAASTADRLKVIKAWGAFGMLSLGGALLTPHGVQGLLHPVQLMSMEATNHIQEWAPSDLTQFSPFTAVLTATLFVALSRGVRAPPVRLALMLLLLFMAFQHARHALVLGLVAPLLLAPAMARALGQTPPTPDSSYRRAVWVLALTLLGAAAVRLAIPVQRGDDAVTPAAALAAVPAELASRPVLNEYGFGGYLIYKGVRPFIDGRADMYGDSFFTEYRRVIGDERSLAQALTRHQVQWTIFPAQHSVVGMMDKRSGWRRLHADETAVVHVRGSAPSPR